MCSCQKETECERRRHHVFLRAAYTCRSRDARRADLFIFSEFALLVSRQYWALYDKTVHCIQISTRNNAFRCYFYRRLEHRSILFCIREVYVTKFIKEFLSSFYRWDKRTFIIVNIFVSRLKIDIKLQSCHMIKMQVEKS